MSKALTVIAALAATVSVLYGGYYLSIDVGRGKSTGVPLAISTPERSAAPVTLSVTERKTIESALAKYRPLIKDVDIQLDGFKLNPYLMNGGDSDWAMFAMSITLNDGTQLRTRKIKTRRKAVTGQISESIHRAMTAYESRRTVPDSRNGQAAVITNI